MAFMKATTYAQILKACGYKCIEKSKYQGVNVYEKQHIFNKIVCTVIKDSHGKGAEMTFNAYGTLRTPKDMYEFKNAEFDRSYLVKEATKIHQAFEELKSKKSPKHIYF